MVQGVWICDIYSSEETSVAISGMDGKDVHGQMVRVNYTTDRTGGFRGGGYGGWAGGGRNPVADARTGRSRSTLGHKKGDAGVFACGKGPVVWCSREGGRLLGARRKEEIAGRATRVREEEAGSRVVLVRGSEKRPAELGEGEGGGVVRARERRGSSAPCGELG
ncbi:hypothetical protein ZIOFF_039070 [Zingiber officinale]|uniref:Uncharacterized protein n=1 Tax=Zingiber officinale TaxID=94328 RepID=A0A8J5G3W6_ZINOF|nr:hypothetical protein ZIOFF_039070 [Zingiber officinale]